MAHVRDGRISMEDKIKNDEVDELAKNGNKIYKVKHAIIMNCRRRIKVTIILQKMLTTIWEKRIEQFQKVQQENPFIVAEGQDGPVNDHKEQEANSNEAEGAQTSLNKKKPKNNDVVDHKEAFPGYPWGNPQIAEKD